MIFFSPAATVRLGSDPADGMGCVGGGGPEQLAVFSITYGLKPDKDRHINTGN